MVTLEDIAREAGCSTATVSRALRKDPRISDATRARVVSIAKRFGYRPDLVSDLSGERRKLVGLVIPNIGNSQYNYDTTLLHDAFSNDNWRIILCCHYNDPTTDSAILHNLVQEGVEGIVHVPCTRDGAEGALGEFPRVPIVELGFRSTSQHVDAVYSDEALAVSELVRYLADLDHQRIAMVTGRRELYHVQARTVSFHKAVTTAGLKIGNCPILNAPANAQAAADEMLRVLHRDDTPTAIIAANGPAAVGVLRTLHREGVAVPGEMSVVGLSDEIWFEATDPPLTSYRMPLREEGVMAAQLLLSRLRPAAEPEPEPRIVSFSGQLVVRDSAAPAKAD